MNVEVAEVAGNGCISHGKAVGRVRNVQAQKAYDVFRRTRSGKVRERRMEIKIKT